jgi:hypothetical protein
MSDIVRKQGDTSDDHVALFKEPSPAPTRLLAYRPEAAAGGGGGRPASSSTLLSRYVVEPAAGGGGGRPALRNLPVYRIERATGGGGGKHRPRYVPFYRPERAAGSGGGAAPSSDSVEYSLDNRLDPRRSMVNVTVMVNCLSFSPSEWRQDIGIPEDAILNPKVNRSSGASLPWEFVNGPSSAAILVKPPRDGKKLKRFHIDYTVRFQDFFDELHPEEARMRFDYIDVFWSTYTAKLLSITYHYPAYLSISNIKPLPFNLLEGNRLVWERQDFPKNQRLKIRIEGTFGKR